MKNNFTLMTSVAIWGWLGLYAEAEASNPRVCAANCLGTKCADTSVYNRCMGLCQGLPGLETCKQAYDTANNQIQDNKNSPGGSGASSSNSNGVPQLSASEKEALLKKIAELEATILRLMNQNRGPDQKEVGEELEDLQKNYTLLYKKLESGKFGPGDQQELDRLFKKIIEITGQGEIRNEEALRKEKAEEERRKREESQQRQQATIAADKSTYDKVMRENANTEVGQLLANDGKNLDDLLKNTPNVGKYISNNISQLTLEQAIALRSALRSKATTTARNDLYNAIDNYISEVNEGKKPAGNGSGAAAPVQPAPQIGVAPPPQAPPRAPAQPRGQPGGGNVGAALGMVQTLDLRNLGYSSVQINNINNSMKGGTSFENAKAQVGPPAGPPKKID
jgi:hypothetical protein